MRFLIEVPGPNQPKLARYSIESTIPVALGDPQHVFPTVRIDLVSASSFAVSPSYATRALVGHYLVWVEDRSH